MDGEIEPDVLETALAESDDPPLIVDIRNPDHFSQGHLPDSENVPFPELPNRIDTIADADEVVTVCPHGKASVKAARIIAAYEGFDGRVESLDGGLEAWDGPIEPTATDGVTDDGQGAADTSADEGPDAPF